jgi:hypothetical protein
MEETWILSIMELENDLGICYKVVRRLPDLDVAESRFFRTKRHAKRQLERWFP